jgi:hypothetical protein
MREILSIGILDEANIFAQSVVFLIVWIIAMAAIILMCWKRRERNSGIALIYAVSLALIHFVAAFVFFFNPRQLVNNKWMFYGFREATYGIVFFAIGNLLLAPFFLNMFNLPVAQEDGASITIPEYQRNFIRKFFYIGVISFFILPFFIFDIPTARALLSSAQQLLVVGVCLICWIAWKENNRRQLRRWLIFAFSFPVLTVLMHGFLGFGTTMTMIILFFIVRFFKIKLRIVIISLILAYLGLSVYLSYMRDRGVIRGAVWGGGSFSERIEAAKNVVLEPEWFNLFSLEHLELIDSRLNQNVLVGAAVEHLALERVAFGQGKTITDSIFALVPRIIWKDKPYVAGGSGTVSEYTGLSFAEQTSVGVGQVMEFYINFGRLGVIIGFLILGIFIAFIGGRAAYYLSKGEIYKFVIWFLPGLAIISGGGSFAEITASAGANIVIARLVTSRYCNLLYFFLITAVIFAIVSRIIGGR